MQVCQLDRNFDEGLSKMLVMSFIVFEKKFSLEDTDLWNV